MKTGLSLVMMRFSSLSCFLMDRLTTEKASDGDSIKHLQGSEAALQVLLQGVVDFFQRSLQKVQGWVPACGRRRLGNGAVIVVSHIEAPVGTKAWHVGSVVSNVLEGHP